MLKTILVTGGAGAIGSNLVNQLSENPKNRVIVFDNMSSGQAKNIVLRPNIKIVQGNVQFDEDVEEAFVVKPIHTVFHLAANFANQNSVDFPQRDLLVNGLGTLKMLLYSMRHKVRRFVYTSSSCVYGNKDKYLDERLTDFSLDTPYAITKLLGEKYVRFFQDHYGMETVTLRYFNVFGPGEYPGKYRNVIANFLFHAIRNEPLVITGGGKETRDFNYVEDTVRATILASESKDAVGQILNIASGREARIVDVAKLIIDITGSSSIIVYKPRRNWDTVTRRVASIRKSRKVLDYQPEISLREGLKRYYAWMRKQDIKKSEW